MIKVSGIPQTKIKLTNLSMLNQHKIMGSVMYASAKPMEEAQRKELMSKTSTTNPTTGIPNTGNLLRSISRMRVPIKKAKEIGTVRVGPKIGGGKKGYHGHLLEFGHKKVLWGRRTNGRVKAFPFVAPAYRSSIGEVRSNIYRNLDRVLKRWVKTGRIVEL